MGKKGERQWSEYTGTPSSTGLPARKLRMRGRTRLDAVSETAPDDPPLWISVGSLPDGRFAELIGFMDIDGVWCVFHAMVPPTKKFKRELGWR